MVEILVDKYTLLNPAQKTLPFYPNSRDEVSYFMSFASPWL